MDRQQEVLERRPEIYGERHNFSSMNQGKAMTASNAPSVLIVDHSPQDRENYCRLLRNQPEKGYKVVEADSAKAGFNIFQSSHPDCTLLDANLPDGDPLQLLHQITAAKKSPHAIVLLTNEGNKSLVHQAICEGAQDYLYKARITAEALDRAIQRAIEKVSFLRKIDEQRRKLDQITMEKVVKLCSPSRPERTAV